MKILIVQAVVILEEKYMVISTNEETTISYHLFKEKTDNKFWYVNRGTGTGRGDCYNQYLNIKCFSKCLFF